MNKKNNFILGYIIGGTTVLIIFPSIFYFLSEKFDLYLPPLLIENFYFRISLFLILLIVGLLFSIWSLLIQYKIGKGGPLEGYKISISPKTQKLNTTGPYRYTRNPMLFGACTFYFSLAIFLNSPSFLLFALIFTIFMVIFVKNTEEKRLLADFGKEYEIYRKKTSLFIPWP